MWAVAGTEVPFHDARLGHPAGGGGPGPTEVVNGLFRGLQLPLGWTFADEVDTLVVVRRTL